MSFWINLHIIYHIFHITTILSPFRQFLLLLIFLVPLHSSFPQERDSSSINYTRLGIMGGITAGAAVGSYFYVKDVWWGRQGSRFHFESTAERYALHLDKMSHFFGGTVEGDFFAGGFQWTGFDEGDARLYGAIIMSNIVSLSVELTDAYAVEHGFSIKDYLSGASGAWYQYLQYKNPSLNALNFKWSYWNHAPKYYTMRAQLIEQNPSRAFIDNYANQTYWATINLRAIAPEPWEESIPPWLGFAVGARAGDVVEVIRKDSQFREFQLYLSLDVDVAQLLPNEGEFWVILRRMISHIHLPAPALRLTPRMRVFGFYM